MNQLYIFKPTLFIKKENASICCLSSETGEQVHAKWNAVFFSCHRTWIEINWRDVLAFILELSLRRISGAKRLAGYTRTIKSASCPDAIRAAHSKQEQIAAGPRKWNESQSRSDTDTESFSLFSTLITHTAAPDWYLHQSLVGPF